MSILHIQTLCDRIQRETGRAPVAVTLDPESFVQLVLDLGSTVRYVKEGREGDELGATGVQLACGTRIFPAGAIERWATRRVAKYLGRHIAGVLQLFKTSKAASIEAFFDLLERAEREAFAVAEDVSP
jgi:hypothetical protein